MGPSGGVRGFANARSRIGANERTLGKNLPAGTRADGVKQVLGRQFSLDQQHARRLVNHHGAGKSLYLSQALLPIRIVCGYANDVPHGEQSNTSEHPLTLQLDAETERFRAYPAQPFSS